MVVVENHGNALLEVGGKPTVYFAGPIDYVEHRLPGIHRQENWRHRFFDHMEINVWCPTCQNEGVTGWDRIMDNNMAGMNGADAMVAYFPGDTATFGTPIEVYQWATGAFQLNKTGMLILVHPAPPGVFVQMLKDLYGMEVVRTFEGARSWLRRRLMQP